MSEPKKQPATAPPAAPPPAAQPPAAQPSPAGVSSAPPPPVPPPPPTAAPPCSFRGSCPADVPFFAGMVGLFLRAVYRDYLGDQREAGKN
ncbi:hypothetical protein SFRURICE_014849 [Spodoptera frugiperda]|nr:hypothetical protein SFRURICE_014849 [Spodoptera frugiperda]